MNRYRWFSGWGIGICWVATLLLLGSFAVFVFSGQEEAEVQKYRVKYERIGPDFVIDDFEKGVTDWASGGGTNDVSRSADAKQGKYSMMVKTNREPQSSNAVIWAGAKGLDWSEYNRIGFWAKTDTLGRGFGPRWCNGEEWNQPQSELYVEPKDKEWHYYEFSINSIYREVVTNFYFCLPTSEGNTKFTTWIDDIRLLKTRKVKKSETDKTEKP